MIHHARNTWTEPAYPITGPAPKAKTTTAVLHYSASNNIPADKAQWLRNMQRDYVNNRGYSLGYWQLVDQQGEAWQIRGPHGNSTIYNSAANKGDKVPGNANDYTYPILLAVTTTEPATQAAINTCKQLWADHGITTRPLAHSDLDYTSCCGDPVRQQIAAGLFDPTPTPPPPNPPPAEGHDMLVNLIHYNNEPAVFAQYSGGYKIWIPTEATLAVYKALNPTLKVTSLNTEWFECAGPILPGTPLPYDGRCDPYGRKT